MSYSISISGHNDGDGDVVKAKETAIAAAAKELAAGLDGVSSATFYGSQITDGNLLAPAPADAEAAEGDDGAAATP